MKTITKITIALAAVAAALFTVSCTKFEEKGETLSSGVVFHASFETVGTPATRTYLDSDHKLLWTADDRLSIFEGNTYNQQYKYIGQTGEASADFEKVQAVGFHSGNDISSNYAVYPYLQDTKIGNDGRMTVTLPSVQKYAVGSFGLGANTMVAVTNGTSDTFLAFKNLCGYLVIKLYGEGTVKQITLTGNNGEKIAGTATVTAAYGSEPSVAMTNTATDEITIDCGTGVTLGSTSQTATEFWFCIPPTTFSKGFNVTVVDPYGMGMTRSVSSSRSIARNTINSMAPLEATFKTYIGIESPFEDPVFEAYCIENFDKDGDGEISREEAQAVTQIDCSRKEIKSLAGIELFTALTHLNCSSNPLTSLDVSNNTALEYLDCYNNQLTSLDVSKNTALTDLSCSYNQLTSLDVSKNTALTSLDCIGNQLTSLDVSKNTALDRLECSSNQLTSLVSNNTALEYLDCYNNQLTSLDVSKNTALDRLECSSNQLTSLDVSKNTALTDLSCWSNQLTSLVSNNTALTSLDCSGNQLTSLDVSNNTALEYLSCYYNQLTSLDVSNNTALTGLSCSNNQLTSLDVSKNTALTGLICDYNQLTSLDVSNNIALTVLSCDYNQLTSLVSNNIALTSLECRNNQLTNLDVSNNIELTDLNCSGMSTLQELDIFQDQDIRYVTTNRSEDYIPSNTQIKVVKDNPYPVVFTAEAVDLGLSVKWSTSNLGTDKPEGRGRYYQWAGLEDVTSRSIYLYWDNCPYYTGSNYEIGWTKYVPSSYSSYWSGTGSPDNKTMLEPEDDVARVKLGGNWRMPTEEEWNELIDNCTWTWTQLNGVNGYKVTSNISGYTDKWIFLPAAGLRTDVYLGNAGSYGFYWSSSLNTDYPDSAYRLRFNSDNVLTYENFRYHGLTVRPVSE